MNQEQALSILITVARLAQSKGALQLEEAEQVLAAIRVFTPKQEQAPQEETVEDAPKKLKK